MPLSDRGKLQEKKRMRRLRKKKERMFRDIVQAEETGRNTIEAEAEEGVCEERGGPCV